MRIHLKSTGTGTAATTSTSYVRIMPYSHNFTTNASSRSYVQGYSCFFQLLTKESSQNYLNDKLCKLKCAESLPPQTFCVGIYADPNETLDSASVLAAG